MAKTNRQWLLRARPVGMVKESDFELREAPLPSPKDGEALVRVLYVAFDPAMRGWMEDRPSYIPPVGLGEVMRAGGVGQIVESRRSDFAVGDLVQGMFGWQEYAHRRRGGLMRATQVPPGHAAHLAARRLRHHRAHRVLRPARPRQAEGRARPWSSRARPARPARSPAQIAKIQGCRVVGIAGGAEKCRWLTEEAHFDAAIDYKREDVARRLRELCPKGIDVYFDNVGGEILDAALAQPGAARARRAVRRRSPATTKRRRRPARAT